MVWSIRAFKTRRATAQALISTQILITLTLDASCISLLEALWACLTDTSLSTSETVRVTSLTRITDLVKEEASRAGTLVKLIQGKAFFTEEACPCEVFTLGAPEATVDALVASHMLVVLQAREASGDAFLEAFWAGVTDTCLGAGQAVIVAWQAHA